MSAGGGSEELDPELDPAERARLEELLRSSGGPQPDPLRREEARQAFLGAPSRFGELARTGGTMLVDDDPFTAWLARHSAAPAPGSDFRRRARLAFLTAVAADVRPSRRTRPGYRALVLVAAAAAILAVTFLLPQPERWRVELGGVARFVPLESTDETEFAPGEDAQLAVALETPGTLEASGASVRVTLGTLELEVHPGAALVMPGLAELDGVEALLFELPRGEAFVRTLPGYPGNPILVRTPVAEVALHGTTVGVLVDENGTCVCVADGTARVTSDRLASWAQEVGARSTLQLFVDREVPPRMVPFPDEGGPDSAHTDALVGFVPR